MIFFFSCLGAEGQAGVGGWVDGWMDGWGSVGERDSRLTKYRRQLYQESDAADRADAAHVLVPDDGFGDALGLRDGGVEVLG